MQEKYRLELEDLNYLLFIIMNMMSGYFWPQHGGAGGTDTAWLKVDPKNVAAWLNDCGGTLSQAVQRIAEIVKTST